MSITIEDLLIQTNFNITHIEFKYNDKLPDNLTIQQCGGMGIIASDLSDLNSCMYSFESLTTNKQILKILIDLDSFYVDSLPADFEKSPRLKSHEIAKIIYDMIVLNNSKGMALQIITIDKSLDDNDFNTEHILWKQKCELPTINSDNYVKLRIHLHDYYITYDILYDENDVPIDIEIDKDYSNNHNRLLYILDKQIGYIEDGQFYTDDRISKKLVLFIISQTTNIEVKCLNI